MRNAGGPGGSPEPAQQKRQSSSRVPPGWRCHGGAQGAAHTAFCEKLRGAVGGWDEGMCVRRIAGSWASVNDFWQLVCLIRSVFEVTASQARPGLNQQHLWLEAERQEALLQLPPALLSVRKIFFSLSVGKRQTSSTENSKSFVKISISQFRLSSPERHWKPENSSEPGVLAERGVRTGGGNAEVSLSSVLWLRLLCDAQGGKELHSRCCATLSQNRNGASVILFLPFHLSCLLFFF